MLLKISRGAVLNPETFMGEGGNGWSVVAEEADPRAAALTEVDFAMVNLGTRFKDGEFSITGEEKLRRMKEDGDVRLDGFVFLEPRAPK